MSDYKPGAMAAVVLADLQRLDEDRATAWGEYQAEYRAHAETRAALAAAEKRAEEAEALLATARDALDPLRADLEEYEGQPARELAGVLMADPEECGPRVCKASVLAALELLEKLEAADDAEARQDARRDYT